MNVGQILILDENLIYMTIFSAITMNIINIIKLSKGDWSNFNV